MLLSAYLPIGRHEARHEPGASKNGYEAAHVVHSVVSGPEHVAHDSAHATHTSRDAALPPEHVNPASMAQLALAWAAKHPMVSSVITGASKVSQIEQNFAAVDVIPLITDEVDEEMRAAVKR